MTIEKIIQEVNKLLDGERLRYDELLPHLDKTINAINSDLQSLYPTFSAAALLPGYNYEYNFFPDHYIQSVVIVGAAWRYYVQDEEGEGVASGYYRDFMEGKSLMVRDFMLSVPEEYQNNEGGFLQMEPAVQVGKWPI